MITLHHRNPTGNSFERRGSLDSIPKTPVREEPGLWFSHRLPFCESAGNLQDENHDGEPGTPDRRLLTIFKEGEEREEWGVAAR